MVNKKPNILLLINDHQNYYRYGWDEGEKPLTPNFERVSNEGMKFERAYTPTAYCVPARRSLFTGMYPSNHGLTTNNEDVPEKETDMFFHYLSEKGYRNFYYGKWHNGKMHLWEQGCQGFSIQGHGNPYSTNEYKLYCQKNNIPEAYCDVRLNFYKNEPEGRVFLREYGTAKPSYGKLLSPKESHESFFLADMACNQLINLKDSKDPWCMIVSFWGPHCPYFVTEEFLKLYNPENFSPYPSYYDELNDKPETYNLLKDKEFKNRNLYQIDRFPKPYPWSFYQECMSYIYAHTTLVDAAGGLILDTLDILGLDKNTLVIWTADHGCDFGAHGGHLSKGPYMTEEVYRIPFAVRWPGIIDSGQTCGKLISLIDLAPTFLDICGTKSSKVFDGSSLLPIFQGKAQEWRDSLLCEFYGAKKEVHNIRSIVTDRYKYISTKDDVHELYDLEKDPYELSNLIHLKEMEPVIEHMKLKLKEWLCKIDNKEAY